MLTSFNSVSSKLVFYNADTIAVIKKLLHLLSNLRW